MLKAMLQYIAFNDATEMISDQDLKFSPLNFAYTQAWMTINDVDAPYQLNEMDLNDLAVFLNVPKPPLKDDIYNFYKLLDEDECECFVDELAKCYKKAGLIGGVVVFFDNHTIPYYGGVPIGFVYHTTRNMPIKGIHLAQLNDINGNFIMFKLIPSTTTFANILVELLERMRRVLDITIPLTLVVDREAEGLPLFQELQRRNIYFTVVITKNSKITKEMESIPESDFKEEFRDKERIMETEITLKDIPFRAGVIMHENGKRYGFRTTIPKENISDIKVIASFIPARWRQENKFEEVKNGEDVDKIARYEFLAAPNIHLQNKYDELQNQLQKVEKRRVKKEEEMEILSKQYEKKKQTYKKRLGAKDEQLVNLEKRIRKAGERNVFERRLKIKMNERDDIIQYYSVALSKIVDKMDEVTKRLEKDNTSKEKMVEELKNIDLDADFFQLKDASTTFNIATKEAVANANSELTKLISSDGQPMKVNRAKKVLYKLPGEITMDSSTKTVVLSSIRNEAQRMRIESLCDWMNEKQVIDTDGKKLIFKVENT